MKNFNHDAIPKSRYVLMTIAILIIAMNSLAQVTSNFTDPRDGKTYKTVKIGTQTWMAENLNYYTNSGSWCYLNEQSYCNTYGRFYNWEAACKVCPSGWHLPRDAEWKELEMALGMKQSEADQMEWRGTIEGSKLAGNASLWESGKLVTSSEFGGSGFKAFPCGYMESIDGSFQLFSQRAYFWSATENCMGRILNYGATEVYRASDLDKYSGYSVRCIKENSSSTSSSKLNLLESDFFIALKRMKVGTEIEKFKYQKEASEAKKKVIDYCKENNLKPSEKFNVESKKIN